MGRYAGYTSTTEDFQYMTIKGLKPILNNSNNYLSGSYTLNGYGNKSTITIKIFKEETEAYLKILFTQKDNLTGEYKDFDYRIDLVSTSCNFGGVRWWFICPCGLNRCGVLYMQSNGIFASRKTLKLIYPEQRDSKRNRYTSYLMGAPFNKLYILSKTIKYQYRNGKLTRKMKRFLKLHYQMPTMEEVSNIGNLLFRK